ncbi:MAG: glycosyl hydrolase, partial [Marivirga sp.]|nr:glycosyl hydrolase [Marivirga sp.]
MKKLILLLVWSCTITSVRSQQLSPGEVLLFSYFKNNGEDGLHLAYSLDGYSWTALRKDSAFLTPTAGKDKLMRDPCIIKGKDGMYHMVWTVSWNEKGIGYASSTDLINWTKQLYIPVMEMEPGTRNCWAPEIYYDHKRSEYVIYWASTVPGRFPQTEGKTEDKYNHRMYYTTTKDFKAFKKTRLLYDPGFNVIDATIIKHNGQYIMFLKDETLDPVKKNLRMAYSKKATGEYSEAGPPFTESWVEGPTVVKMQDQWIVYFDR